MMNRINIRELLDSPSALTREQGEIVYNYLIDKISKKETVILDFSEIESLITPFLNIAIGKLYKTFTSEELNQYLSIENIPASKKATLKIVIENAKRFYKDPKTFQSIVEGELN